MTEDNFNAVLGILREGRWKVDIGLGLVTTKNGIAEQENRFGYKKISTTFKGKHHNFFIHQIIAVAGGLCPVNKTINHKNGNKRDNRIANLEVISFKKNIKHAHETGLIKQSGDRSHFSKLTKSDVAEIKNLLREGETQSVIAERYGVFQTTISKIKMGETWSDIS